MKQNKTNLLKLIAFVLVIGSPLLSNAQFGKLKNMKKNLENMSKVPHFEKLQEVEFSTGEKKQIKKFKYRVLLEDQGNVLQNFGLNEKFMMGYLGIDGQSFVDKNEDADVIYKYVFKQVSLTDQKIDKTGSVLSKGGINHPYYSADGIYHFEICRQIYDPSKTESITCEKIDEFTNVKINTKPGINKEEEVNEWNSSSFINSEMNRELRSRLVKDFSFLTSKYAEKKLISNFTNIAFFKSNETASDGSVRGLVSGGKSKDNKKHKKGTSDKYARDLNVFLNLINVDFNEYYVNTCLNDSSKKTSNVEDCLISLREKIKQKATVLNQAQIFWKDQLINKYNTPNKKSNERIVMAQNLFTTSLVLENFSDCDYALEILKKEKYGNESDHIGSYTKLSNGYEVLKNSFKLIPRYFKYQLKSNLGVLKGSDYPLILK